MNITAENIDQWCFRYLEKDLSREEFVFFENELKNNSILAKQMSLWKQTVIKADAILQPSTAVSTSLFRYQNRLLMALIEFVFVVGTLTFFVFNYTKKDRVPPKEIDIKSAVSIPSSIRKSSDTIFAEKIQSSKSTYINILMDQQKDSAAVLPMDKTDDIKIIKPDTVNLNTDQSTIVPNEVKQIKNSKTITDSATTHPKSTVKKNTSKHKYRGSRLIPINNDL